MKNLSTLMCFLALALGGTLRAQEKLDYILFSLCATQMLDAGEEIELRIKFSATAGDRFIVSWGYGQVDTVQIAKTDEMVECSHHFKEGDMIDRTLVLRALDTRSHIIGFALEDSIYNDVAPYDCPALRDLSFSNTSITYLRPEIQSLQSIKCVNNPLLWELSLYECPSLKKVECSGNRSLKRLILSNNYELEEVVCTYNDSLEMPELPSGGNFKTVDCSNNNQLKSLSLLDQPILKTVKCTNNPLLESLELHDCPSLDSLNFSNNAQVDYLGIKNTGLKSLDLSVAPNLESLYCDGNDSLTTLYIDHPKLESLDLHNLPTLQYLSCRNTMLPGLSFSADNSLPSLQTLECSGNPLLERLELTNCPLLDSLKFADNTQLKALTIGHTKLRSLDLSVAPNLKTLYCKPNQLTSLKLSSDVLLEWLVCDSNCLTLSNVADLVNSSLDVTVSPQLIPVLRQVGHTLDLRSEMNINDEATKWNVLDSVGNIITDYTNTGWEGYRNGHFFFTKTGRYRIALHHDALLRHDGVLMPADVYYDVTVVDSVARPVFSAPSGAVKRHTPVSLSTITPDARIYYTTDGSVPDSAALLYTEPISIDEAVTIKAIAIQDTFASRVATASYMIDSTANESDKATERVRIYVQGRNICLSESVGEVEVFTANGQCVYRGSAIAIPVKRSGLYVVVAKGGRWKVAVR